MDEKKTAGSAETPAVDPTNDQDATAGIVAKKEATSGSSSLSEQSAPNDSEPQEVSEVTAASGSTAENGDGTPTPDIIPTLETEKEPPTGSDEGAGQNESEQTSNTETSVAPAVAAPIIQQPEAVAVAGAVVGVEAPTPKPGRKRLIIITVAVVLALAIVAVVLKLTLWNTASVQEGADAKAQSTAKLGVAVTLVDGEASYRRGNAEWKALATSTQLQEGDGVRTGTAGRVVLTFDDGSALRLDHASTVTLTSLAAKDIRITQAQGMAYSRVVASDRSYIVTIDKVNYQALGTAFVTVNAESEKGVQVYHSKVKVDGMKDAVSEGKQYYRQHKTEALKGKVSDLDLDALAANEFVDWNTIEDEKESAFKERLGVLKTIREKRELARENAERTTQSTPPQAAAVLQLSGVASDKGAALTWTVSGVDTSSGFKIVRSANTQTPTFGRDDAVYIDKAAARNYTWSTKKAGTYWYRVCAYRPAAGGCVNYSNAVQVTTTGSSSDDYKDGEKVTRGSMTLAVDAGGNVTWSYTGVAVHGYKLVVSKSQNPTYPDNSVAYFDRYKTSGTVNVSQAGTYYVRICAWTNGTQSEPCVDYSNQVTFTKS